MLAVASARDTNTSRANLLVSVSALLEFEEYKAREYLNLTSLHIAQSLVEPLVASVKCGCSQRPQRVLWESSLQPMKGLRTNSPAVHRRIEIFMKHHLREAVAVAQVHENNPAVIPAPVHPTHQHCVAAFIGGAQFAACVRALQVA